MCVMCVPLSLSSIQPYVKQKYATLYNGEARRGEPSSDAGENEKRVVRSNEAEDDVLSRCDLVNTA